MLKQSRLVRMLFLSLPLTVLPACGQTSYQDRPPETRKIMTITVAGSERKARAYITTNTKEDAENGIYSTEYYIINDTDIALGLRDLLTNKYNEIKGQENKGLIDN